MSVTSSNVDLATKYQKLAAEYSKIRSHLPVLKEALTSEKATNAELTESLSECRQNQRRKESEIESLVFRNQQLAKRVEALQDKLDSLAHAKTKKKSKEKSENGSVSNAAGHILEEELTNKLEENMQLHTKVYELEEKYGTEQRELETKIGRLERENVNLQKELTAVKDENLTLSEKSNADNRAANQTVIKLKSELDNLKSKSEAINSENLRDLDKADRLLKNQFIFDDSHDDDLNPFNISSSAPEVLDPQFFTDLKKNYESLSTGFLNVFSYMDQRTKIYPQDDSMEALSECSILLSKSLVTGLSKMQCLSDSVKDLLTNHCLSNSNNQESIIRKVLPKISEELRSLSDHLSTELRKLTEKSIQEECAVSWCTPRLSQENQKWIEKLNDLCSSSQILAGTFGDLSQFLAGKPNADSDFEWTEKLDFFISSFDQFALNSKGCSDAYGGKITFEHQLPTATKSLRTTNECIIASLNSVQKQTSLIVDQLRNNKAALISHLKELSKWTPETMAMEQTAQDFFEQVQQEIEDMDEAEPLHNIRPQSDSFADSAIMDLQEIKALKLQQKSTKMLDLEKEKEKLLMDVKLLQMKLSSSNNNDSKGDGEEEMSEEFVLMENHYRSRIAELLDALAENEGMVVYFKQECRRLAKCLQVATHQKNLLKVENETQKEAVEKLKEDLKTTQEGYEGQMASLSEHLAEMNQKVSSQSEEMDLLRNSISKSRDSGGNKVGRKLRDRFK